METNLLAPLLLVPSLVYLVIHRVQKQSGRESARALGWTLPSWRDLGEVSISRVLLKIQERMVLYAIRKMSGAN